MLKIENLFAGYTKDNLILKNVSLSVNDNETMGIIGQNGAGKSTLAKAIIGMVPFLSGSIVFDGVQLLGLKTNEIAKLGVSYFLQGGRVFPHLTIFENLLFAARNFSKSERRNRIEEIKSYFELFQDNKINRQNLYASYLSGGEKHQLALAMILLQKPKLIILDEPSAGLSPGTLQMIKNILVQLKEQINTIFFIIEQNVQLAFELSDTTTVLKNGVIEKTIKTKSFSEIEKFIFN